jgi:hypothetical protein
MKAVKVNLIGNCLVFFKNDEVFYHLREFDLEEIRVINQKEVSACIVDLSQKTWVSISLLYQVAKLIEDNYPAIKMNWENTFCHIEHSDYVKSACDIVNLAKFEEKGDVAKVIHEIIAARSTSEIEKREIRDIVISNLKDYGLIN